MHYGSDTGLDTRTEAHILLPVPWLLKADCQFNIQPCFWWYSPQKYQ